MQDKVKTLKTRARDELIRLYEVSGNKFANLNPKQQSIEAVRFFISEIHNPTRTFLSEDEISESIVDGANDLGCDFIYRDNGHVILIQSKYRKASNPENVSEVSHFQSILNRFRDHSLKRNKRLEDAILDIDWDHDSFELIFITFAKLEGQARLVSEQPGNYPTDISDLEQRCEWRYLDESDLNTSLRGARDLQRGVTDKTVSIYPIGQKGMRGAPSVIQIQAGQYQSFIMTLDARQITKAYEELGRDALFSLNIRNFIGNTKTNKEIIKSARDEAEQFFIYNNGISCLATKVAVSPESIQVTGLQVINGAQTVKALAHTAKKIDQEKSSKWSSHIPQVLVRITEIPEGYGSTGRSREKITQYNNTQNTIKDSDFRSNDPVHKSIAEQFGKIVRKGKKALYLPKRTDRVPVNSDVVRLEEFAKSVFAFLYDPTAFSGSSSFLFNDDREGGYSKVFGDGESIWERMPEDEFKLRAGIYWLSQEFSAYLRKVRNDELDADARAALERKWLIIYAAGVVFKITYPKDEWKKQVSKLHKADWSLSSDDKKSEVILKIFQAAKSAVVMTYANSKRNTPGFVHRNWMRSKNTPDEIAEFIRHTVLQLTSIPEIPG